MVTRILAQTKGNGTYFRNPSRPRFQFVRKYTDPDPTTGSISTTSTTRILKATFQVECPVQILDHTNLCHLDSETSCRDKRVGLGVPWQGVGSRQRGGPFCWCSRRKAVQKNKSHVLVCVSRAVRIDVPQKWQDKTKMAEGLTSFDPEWATLFFFFFFPNGLPSSA